MEKLLKRLICLFLSIAFLTTVLPTKITAASDEEIARVEEQLTDVYWQSISASGRGSLQGYCGILAGWELYFLGVTERSITHNGNQMYDIMSQSEELREGYTAECYPASQYTIGEALNTITNFGTRDAYNIMVGFQWTKTAAGNIYGHVMVIHAILNGTVYYSDCFSTPYHINTTQAMCSIEEFDAYYNSWTRFEGLIHFGDGKRIPGCDTYGCDLFVAGDQPVELYTMPEFPEEGCVRTVAPRERLYANAICRNAQGVLFYRIEEAGAEYYAPADLLQPVWFGTSELTSKDVNLPVQVDKGQDHWLSGVIRSGNAPIVNVILQVRDQNGRMIMESVFEKNGNMLDLGTDAVNTRSDISNLPDGRYTYSVYCDLESSYCAEGEITGQVQRVLAAERDFLVGNAIPEEMSKNVRVSAAKSKMAIDGWNYENGHWYYYEDGVCRTGWFCYEGIDYYFLEDGSAATGWHTIHGKPRYFSETGAMRIGWLETAEGTYYMLSNGAPAIGQTEIAGQMYCFDENGMLESDIDAE